MAFLLSRLPFVLLVFSACTVLCQDAPMSDDSRKDTPRPEKWAVPIEKEGVPNLHKVSDQLYRSAQPTAEGMKKLKDLGIKTIVCLRAFHSDNDEIEDSGEEFRIERIKINTWDIENEQVLQFLRIVSDPEKTPVLVHCQHGADRTGTMCAAYRMIMQGWTKDDALKELKEGGYNFHKVWKNIEKFIDGLDVEAMRKELNKTERQSSK